MKRFVYLAVVLGIATACGSSDSTSPSNRPVAHAGGPYTTSSGSVKFDGHTSTDPGNTTLTYAWKFGDGGVGVGDTVTHTYTTSGTFKASLIVTNTAGTASTPDTATVTVSGAGTVVFSGAGNSTNCRNNNDEATAKLLDALPGFVFAGGNNAFDNGAASDYTSCYDPTWGREKARTYPVLGNHDYGLGAADGTFSYFGANAGPAGLGYYSVDLGSWHVIVLNDNATYVPFAAGSTQETWLKADLAANTKQCTIALWHTPLFQSSDSVGYITNSTRKILWDDLYAANADIVVNSNSYWYERMAPMNSSGALDAARGILQFNVGTGGESLGTLPTISIHPNSQIRAAVYGVLSLTLKPGGYDWQFIPVAGQTFTDSGSGTCH